MQTKYNRMAWAAAAVLLVVAIPAGVAAPGGGTVTNRLPTAETFTVGLALDNVGDSGIFSGTVKDRNREADMQALKVTRLSGPDTVADQVRTLAAADRIATAEPGSFDAGGWKVWNPLANDGLLSFKLQLTYPSTAGTYVFRLWVKDEGAYQNGPAPDVTVTLEEKILVSTSPVHFDGTPDTGANWGAWTAEPGATNVNATNYLKVTNVGVTPRQIFSVDFSGLTFAGSPDATSSIGIDTNIQFAWWEDLTPLDTAPSQGTFTWLAASGSGSVTPEFTVLDSIIYVTYRISLVPDPVADQSYVATYTIEPL